MPDSIISVHPFRRTARKRERAIQAWLDDRLQGIEIISKHGFFQVPVNRAQTEIVSVPAWARGVKVVKAGTLQYAVVPTVDSGH